MKILISGGSYKFHMTPLAAEFAARDSLAGYVTAGYPVGWQRWLAHQFPSSPGWNRFLARYEPIPEDLLHTQPVVEIFLKIGDVVLRKFSQRAQQNLHRLAFRVYSRGCHTALAKSTPDIYHYRNCYGVSSVEVARAMGVIALCDHSIAHPLCLSWMESNKGRWPPPEQFEDIRRTMLPLYRQMEDDLHRADHTVVNSDFVKATCVYAGMAAEKIHVVYLGVDEAFFKDTESADRTKTASTSSVLYAGGWQRRKGVEDLAKSLLALERPWSLDIAGGLESEVLHIHGMRDFLADSRVRHLGILPRKDLAGLMGSHRIFVFPSYCEGSARVIFEAMASGCFVITTQNSGSIVQDGVHGRLVAEGDVDALACAITEALDNPEWVEHIGRMNRQLVAKSYRQRDYADRVMEIYRLAAGVNDG